MLEREEGTAAGRRPRHHRRDQSFELFFDELWPRARAMTARMGLSREESEDVVLDALAVTYDRWSRVRDLAYRDAWTLKVAANLARKALRARRRSPLGVTGPARSMEQDVADRVTLRHAMAGLSRRQHEVVTLRYLADLPETDVARVLGVDVGSVKQHASRGRAALRDLLTVAGEDADDAR